MKKLILAGLVATSLLAVCTPSFAGLGIKAGYVHANQNYDYTDEMINLDPGYLGGFDAGISFEFLSLPVFGLVAEAHYIQKGMKVDIPDISGPEPTSVEYKNKINYLSVPALAKVSLGGLYAIAGPRIDILLSKSVDSQFDSIYDKFETFVTGYDAGVGYQLGIVPALSPLIELRYSGDFKDSYKSDTLSVNNKSFQLLVGVMF